MESANEKKIEYNFKEGNSHWTKRTKHGRNKIFSDPETLWNAALEYFDYVDSNPYFKSEQKKGNTVISKNATLSDDNMNDVLNPIVNIPTIKPYLIGGLCLYLGVNTQYFNDFEKSLDNMKDRQMALDFSLTITRIREIISNQKIEGAAVGAFNPMIVSRVEGLKERTDITSNDEQISISTVKFDVSKPEQQNKAGELM